jgi:hypothetical protein
MESVPFAAGGPAAVLRSIRSEAMAKIDVLEAQIVELRRATVATYINAVADKPEADVRAMLTALETQIVAPLHGDLPRVAAIVVDYRPPINSADIIGSAEVRAARHVLEHVVLAQDAHATELRSDVSNVVVQIEAGTVQQFCNTGGLDGTPYSAREIMDAVSMHASQHVRDWLGANWATVTCM